MSEKKKPAKVEQDETILKIPNMYKKKCDLNGLTASKLIREKVDKAIEEGKLQILQMWEELGPIQIRAFMDGLSDLNYQNLKRIRLWKVDIQDEGVRAICNYVDKVNSVDYLDLMDNNITALGCQFIGKSFLKGDCKISKFRIDNNPIGNEGLKNIALGLRQNDNLQKISLNFCGITQGGVIYLQDIMANIGCQLRTLKLAGNPLKNEGIYEVLRAVNTCGEKLQKLNLSDVQMNILAFTEDIEVTIEEKITKELIAILEKNPSIAKYNFRNNWIPDTVAKKMLDAVKENKIIFIIDLPECISHPLKELHAEIMKKRKLKKKKKKGKGKKGKGKGKSPKK